MSSKNPDHHRKVTCLFLVLGFNNHKITHTCIELLERHLGNSRQYSFLLFDNGSQPTLSSLSKKKSVSYVRSKTNLGFAKGYNFIVRKELQRNFDVICLLNNDVFIDNEFAVKLPRALADFMDNRNQALMQPCLYSDPEHTRVENFGVSVHESGLAFQNTKKDQLKTAEINGACCFIKMSVCRTIFEKYGYLYIPEYEMYAEDIELSIRLKKLGYATKVHPTLHAQHLGSVSLGRVSFNSLFFAWRNLLWTQIIHHNKSDLFRTVPKIVLGQFVLIGLSIRHGYPFLVPLIYFSTYEYRSFLRKARAKMLGIEKRVEYSTKDMVSKNNFAHV